ncbi:MAG TPA: hypothetical protein VHO50_02020 [Bacteroidales bacterium]|nr:hypothetical protein [Bacteroidales bacterium]
MTLREKTDNIQTGILSGILVPLLTALIIYLFTADGLSISSYLTKISTGNIVTHAITLCVFPNVVIFFFFNRYDMLMACRGVLAVTIAWAIIVFAIKLF